MMYTASISSVNRLIRFTVTQIPSHSDVAMVIPLITKQIDVPLCIRIPRSNGLGQHLAVMFLVLVKVKICRFNDLFQPVGSRHPCLSN